MGPVPLRPTRIICGRNMAAPASIFATACSSTEWFPLPGVSGSVLSWSPPPGRPFNITVGRDLNGDTLFTDRPAFATDLTRATSAGPPSAPSTSAPAGQTLVPRNYGDGPGQVALNLRVAKAFKLGEEVKGKRDPMELTVTALSRNLLNHPNLALPVGI